MSRGESHEGEQEARDPPPHRERSAQGGQSPRAGLRVGDDVNIDVARVPDHRRCRARTTEEARQHTSAAHPDDELGRVDAASEIDQRSRNLLTHDLVVGAAQRFGELLLSLEDAGVTLCETIRRGDMHGEQLSAARTAGDACPPAEQGLALASAGEGDDYPFAGIPGAVDALLRPVPPQRRVHLIGEPEQGQLAQRGEVAQTKVVAEGGIHSTGGVDHALAEPVTQGLGREVDQFDLVGASQDRVGDRLALYDTGDLAHDVVEGLDVLDVHCRDHVDAGSEDRLDVLPAFVVRGARRVGVGEFVDEGEFGLARQHGVEIHLLQHHAAVFDGLPRDELQPLDQSGCGGAAVGLHDGEHDILARSGQAAPLLEHGVGLAHARGGPEHHAEPAPGHGLIIPASRARCSVAAR